MPFVAVAHRHHEPSMQAIELSQRLQQTIAEYQQRNPSLTGEEIQQATELAAQKTSQGTSSARPVVALVAGGAAAVALGVGLWTTQNPGSSGTAMVPMAVVAAIAAVLIAVIRMRRG